MTLQIDSAKAEDLARRLAELAGESIEDAVTAALEERLSRVQAHAPGERAGISDQLLALSRRSAPLFKPPFDTMEHGDILYDDDGKPA